jgi:hypothetical protein
VCSIHPEEMWLLSYLMIPDCRQELVCFCHWAAAGVLSLWQRGHPCPPTGSGHIFSLGADPQVLRLHRMAHLFPVPDSHVRAVSIQHLV